MEVVLDDNELKEFIEMDVPKPTDATQADAWQKKTTKCQRILLEGMKDHIVSSLHGKATPYLMWKSLTELFQCKSDQRKLALKDKLINIKCEKRDSMPKYLTKFTQCRDELRSVGVTVDDEDLVSLTLLGLSKSWHSYQDSVNGREKFPGWERLWSDLVQEEIRHCSRDESSSKGADEENCALAAKENKGKSKKASQTSLKGKKQDMSKVKCFQSHQHGHYATNCPQKKKNKKTTSETRKIRVRVRNLYQLHVDGCAVMAGKAEGLVSRDDSELWHRRLGHLHHGSLKILQQITTGLPKGTLAQSDQCKGCTFWKFVKATFHEKDSCATTILKRIHTDVCGPFSVASIAKHRYYVIFVDDFYCKCWIFFMQKKSKTYSKFCEFKALVEKESGKKVNALSSDNGGEYILDEFKDFYKAEGIQRELIAPHNPQQNGVAE
eukprot:PITA_25348